MTTSAIRTGPGIEVLDGYTRGTMPTFPGKYLSVTTFRGDGTPVATPVWFVEENGRLLVETDAGSGKVKRIRRDPSVLIAPCNARGKVKATPTPARAEILSEGYRKHLRSLIARKYRMDLVFIKPIRKIQSLFGGREVDPVVVAITPAGVH